MEKYKIGFLILHYLTKEDTIKCIDSILEKIDTDNFHITIVDNGSKNHTGEEIGSKYLKNKNINIILNKKNYGFSKGNNIGFKYLKNEVKCNFIVMLNNDTYLIQNNFFKIIIEEYEKSNFGVMGPKIILPQNKILKETSILAKNQIIKLIFKQTIWLFLEYFYLMGVYKKIKIKILNKKENEINFYNNNNRIKNKILHGCCIVFSPLYINKFDEIDEKTFLFREEELLYLKILKNNMISIYNPNLLIHHSEDKSTNAKFKGERLKNIFIYKNQIKSNFILLLNL